MLPSWANGGLMLVPTTEGQLFKRSCVPPGRRVIYAFIALIYDTVAALDARVLGEELKKQAEALGERARRS